MSLHFFALAKLNNIMKWCFVTCIEPVDGHWGKWTTWGNCSKTCGLGTKTRTRECNDPAPKHNGKNCPGSNTETGECQLKECGAGDSNSRYLFPII